MEIGPVPLHGGDAHGQDMSGVVTRLHFGQVHHGSNQKAGAHQQRERQRRLNHGHASQKPPFAESGATFRPGALEHAHRIEPGRAEGGEKPGQNRGYDRRAESTDQRRPARRHGVETRDGMSANQFEQLDYSKRKAHAEYSA